MQDYFHIVNQFLRLEKIEFGGIRGQVLSDLVAEMYTKFTDLSSQFQSQIKDPMNITNTVSWEECEREGEEVEKEEEEEVGEGREG